ncbi:hypothetical protein SAMN06265367_102437 [Algoriphagus winogradskyi]|uniref:Uncharacterized protein n=1 Tax=Algoriphagus winogradskyi TaxID=237017 RepID=A0ABY1NPV9_9BACT|nr:hypothetical protein SAMN06265367_102437 [Algoriphagus winogradskyi]
MFKRLDKRFKVRLIVTFIFLLIFDFMYALVFPSSEPIWFQFIGSFFSSGVIVIGLAHFFNKYVQKSNG